MSESNNRNPDPFCLGCEALAKELFQAREHNVALHAENAKLLELVSRADVIIDRRIPAEDCTCAQCREVRQFQSDLAAARELLKWKIT